jgi:hypothetical protein
MAMTVLWTVSVRVVDGRWSAGGVDDDDDDDEDDR